MSGPVDAVFTGASGNRMRGDVFGRHGAPVLLLHGGGQTRHAWRATAERVARAGHIAYAVDLRGHGDSEWIADGSYSFIDFAADVRALAGTLTARCGLQPVVIGASLGGISALLAEGAAMQKGSGLFSALVLVDITPRVDATGLAKIQGFMRAHAAEGFASVAEAADAVAAYLPHRPRPRSQDGLKKNLRLHPDGRWRWHWDPRFLTGRKMSGAGRDALEKAMIEAARRIRIRRCWCAAHPPNSFTRPMSGSFWSSSRTPNLPTSRGQGTWLPAIATTSLPQRFSVFSGGCKVCRGRESLRHCKGNLAPPNVLV